MKTIKIAIFILTVLSMLLLSQACSSDSEVTPPQNDDPKVNIELITVESNSVEFTITTSNATRAAWLVISSSDRVLSAEGILNNGTELQPNSTVTLSANSLLPESDYIIIAAATNGKTHEMTQIEFTTTAQEATESHALIVFLQGGDNGLAEFMDVNLQNIINAYYDLPEGAQIVIFYDRGNYTRLTELYMSDGMVKQRLIKDYNKTLSSVDPEFMSGVFDLIKEEIVADSYGIVLSSHGGGWVPSDIYNYYLNYDWSGSESTSFTTAPLFYGQDSSERMEIPTLSEVISTFHYEYIIFDACFMSSVEALYDLRTNSDYIIASSAEVLGNGFPYSDILPLLFLPDHGLEQICKSYMDSYKNSSGTISLIDCSKLDNLATAMAKVVAQSDNTIDATQIQGYECYPIHLYYDLEQHVEQMTDDEALREEFRNALGSAVIYTDHTPTFFSSLKGEHTIDLPRSCGLTCHVEREEFPQTHSAYLETSWAKAIGAK